MNGTKEIEAKTGHTLEKPTDQTHMRFILAVDRASQETAAFWLEVPAKSTLNLGDYLPGVASGLVVVRPLPAGITEAEVRAQIEKRGIHLTDWSTDVPGVFVFGNGRIIFNVRSSPMGVIVMIADDQAGPDGKHHMREVDLTVPPRKGIRLSANERAEFVLPEDASRAEVRRALRRKYDDVSGRQKHDEERL